MKLSMIIKVAALFVWSLNTATLASAQSGAHAVTAHLYADGSVQCSGADDVSNKVGKVVLKTVEEGVSFQVVLTHAASNWNYYVELSQGGTCREIQRFYGFKTGKNGNGVFKGVYAVNSGSYQLLVDVVSDPSSLVPPDPTHREIAPGELINIVVPSQTPDKDWIRQNPLPTGHDMHDVSFTDSNTGTAVGSSGTILSTGRNDAPSNVSANTLPGLIVLHDNYPNPFNPITNISFDLPQTGRVSLKVYDLLGRLVRTLVNEDLSKSSHTYQWDGTDVGGGRW
jgi:hypothetical protein